MANIHDEIKELRARNNELVQKVQYWKMTAAEREKEKFKLMKEINDLRLKLCRFRNGSAAQVRKLDSELQTTSKEALTHLVQASAAITRTIEITNTYIREKKELDVSSPRWSAISGTPSSKVLKVPPMMLGGQFIQPVVTLDRHINNTRAPRSPTNTHHRTITPLPIHMLQDLYIPLTRVDMDMPNNVEAPEDADNMDDSTEHLGLENDIEEAMEVSQNVLDEHESFLEAIVEDEQGETNESTRSRAENPLEGPSWLLDSSDNKYLSRVSLEADSTTQPEDGASGPDESETSVFGRVFTPTVRVRRKRAASPSSPRSPPRAAPRKIGGRVLQVLISKIRLDGDAPSPNGATIPGVIISDTSTTADDTTTTESVVSRASERNSCDGRRPEHTHARDNSTHCDPQQKSCDAATIETSKILDTANINCAKRQKSRAGITICDSRPGPSTTNDTRASGDARVSGDTGTSGDTRASGETRCSNDTLTSSDNRYNQDDSGSSDGSSTGVHRGRTRRSRKPVTYKEKPLNRKLRR